MIQNAESTLSNDKNLPLTPKGYQKKGSGFEEPESSRIARSKHLGRNIFLIFARVLPFLSVFIAGGIIGLYYQPPGLQQFFRLTGLTPGGGTDTPLAQAIDAVRKQEKVAVISQGEVVALGRVIPREDVVTLAMPFGSGDARIEELRFKTGDHVSSGAIVAVLDNRTALEGALTAARAAVEVQRAALDQAKATILASREEARAAFERAQATNRVAQSQFARTEELLDRGTTTRRIYEEERARAEEAARDVEQAQATLSRYLGDETQQPDIILANANLRAAQADLSRALNDMEKAFVRAPIAGTVLDVNVRAGERPGSEGIIILGNTEVMTVEAEVYQTLIGRVSIGDPALIIADAFDRDLSGTVTAIGLQIGRQTITSDDPAANTDARVVDVIITLDERSTPQARRYTNLETVVRIDTGKRE